MASVQLGITFFDEGAKSQEVNGNDAIATLDAMVFLSVKDRDLTAPPGSPVEGDRYLIATSPTGAWTGKAGYVTLYHGGEWLFFVMRENMVIGVDDEDRLLFSDGSVWQWGIPRSAHTGITAFAGGGQASAVSITADLFVVSTCATNGDSVKLPNPWKGGVIHGKNMGAATCAVFAPSGKSMDGVSNGSVSVPTGKGCRFFSVDGTNWYSLVGA